MAVLNERCEKQGAEKPWNLTVWNGQGSQSTSTFCLTESKSSQSLIPIAQIIGADSLGYLSLEHVRELAPDSGPFCTACFGGGYPTSVPEH